MRSPLPPRSRVLELNLTSMIDVVFLLVIFFLVTSHFSRTDGGPDVQLPLATRGIEDDQVHRLTVTVEAGGQYSVGGRTVSISEIDEMIGSEAAGDPSGLAVRIRGDRAARYAQIEPILLACARHQVTRFGFHVIQK